MGETIPLLADHQNAIEAIVGTGRARIDAGRVLIEGELTRTPLADHVVALAHAGVKLQASIGLEPLEVEKPKGSTVFVNGRNQQISPERELFGRDFTRMLAGGIGC